MKQSLLIYAVLINTKYEWYCSFGSLQSCSVQKTISLVETKQNEEKQELLQAINAERKRIVNELESKEKSEDLLISLMNMTFLVYENQVLELDEQIAEQQQLLKKLKTYKVMKTDSKMRITPLFWISGHRISGERTCSSEIITRNRRNQSFRFGTSNLPSLISNCHFSFTGRS